MGNQDQRHHQKDQRRKRDERAFVFDSTMTQCLAEFERDDWEWAIEMAGGNVGEAAEAAGISGIPRNARALWGKSQPHALESYRQWCNRKAKHKGKG